MIFWRHDSRGWQAFFMAKLGAMAGLEYFAIRSASMKDAYTEKLQNLDERALQMRPGNEKLCIVYIMNMV